jgi:hypothetical protein
MTSPFCITSLLALGLATACKAPPVPDYEKFYAETPFTVVVPPVRNQTADAEAPRFFLATMTKPLVDRGYYVLPVEATADILAAEGLGDGGDLANVPPARFAEYLGADAILFVNLLSWDTTYAVLVSQVSVAMHYQLVSTRSGAVLWETNHEEVIQSNSGGVGIAGLVTAAINAAVTAASTDYVPMAMQANLKACKTLPAGPYHPRFEEEKKQHLERARQKREAFKTKGDPDATASDAGA